VQGSFAVCDHYAGNQKFVDKALVYRERLGPIFDITIDLEDGAALSEIQQAATWAKNQLTAIDNDQAHNTSHRAEHGQDSQCGVGKFGIRLHPYASSAFAKELDILLAQPLPALAYVMLPKAESAQQVQAAKESITLICKQNGIEQAPYLHVLIETHGALAEVHAIAAIDNVQSLSFGLMDFVSSHNGAISDEAMRSPKQFTHPLVGRAKLEIAAACHRFSKTPSHNVCTDVKNPSQAAADASIAKTEFGYTRMWSIHPAQIERPLHDPDFS